ncbi:MULTISPECIES: ferritin-like domain-containing protein [Sporosarcina]|uniref:Rubrerythrin n=1 Tax=Sporosarcina newyorkensis TaxID=759851 RepID=A0A1T4YHJ1_9BACL|nr:MULTISPECIES: ferritin-like domain-containing protein [Sporosarcina]MBY0222810.1 ferritin-like domain-containing protein [Sporosarcina aquimarina]SKB01130.1 Rubrerythrin [Sporosarcina newyorkensis]
MFVNQLKSAIEDEYKSYFYYKSMYQLTNDPLWQEFIRHAYEDEKSHYEMFQQLYYMMTGKFVPNPKKLAPCTNLKECAKNALVDELDAVEQYKEMLLTVPFDQAYDPVFIAMHDEMEHAIRMSTIFNGTK